MALLSPVECPCSRSRALHSPSAATTAANAPRMAKIHLAQAALHRLGTDEAASRGAEQRGWREAEAAPAGHR